MNDGVITEILCKEEEKHCLQHVGSTTDIQVIVKQLSEKTTALQGTFAEQKSMLLRYFYDEIVHYAEFVEKNKASNERFSSHLKNKTKAYILVQRKNKPAVLDKEMKTGAKLTVAYYPAVCIIDGFYRDFCCAPALFSTPTEIERFFQLKVDAEYPLLFPAYLEYLIANEASFWELTGVYIKNLAEIVTACHLGRHAKKDLIKDYAWTDTYEVLAKRIVEEQLATAQFADGQKFRAYILGVLKNKVKTWRDKFTEPLSSIEDIKYEASREEEDAELLTLADNLLHEENEGYDEGVKELNVDVANPHEVYMAIVIILLNKDHRFHQELISGMEDKLAIVLAKTIEGKSYNQIAWELIDNKLQGKDLERVTAKMRKDYERIGQKLIDRFMGIVKKYGL